MFIVKHHCWKLLYLAQHLLMNSLSSDDNDCTLNGSKVVCCQWATEDGH